MGVFPFTGAPAAVATPALPIAPVGPGSVAGGAVDGAGFETLQKFFSPALVGDNWNHLLAAMATGDDYVVATAQAGFDQLFVASASGSYLDRHGADSGTPRPAGIGMSDDQYRRLIINARTDQLTLEALLELVEICYGEDSTRAFVKATVSQPYSLEDEAYLKLRIDERDDVTIRFASNDFQDITAATALEVAAVITRTCEYFGVNCYAVAKLDADTGLTAVKIYSGALGLRGSVRVLGGKAQNVLRFPTDIATTQDITTEWVVSAGSEAGRALFAWNGLGTDPSLWMVHVGDVANVFGSGFADGNQGAFEILEVNGTSFEVYNEQMAAQAMAQLAADDIVFYRPTNHNIYHSLHPAIVAQPDRFDLDVLLPATTDIVARDAGTAAYMGAFEGLAVTAASRGTDGICTFTTTDPHGLSVGSRILIEGVELGVVSSNPQVGSTGALVQKRMQHTATVLQDGRVLVAGGLDNGVVRDTANLYNGSTWSAAATMITGRYGHQAFLLPNGRVLVVGGFNGGALVNCELYDPDANVWAPTGSMGYARAFFGGAVLSDGRVVVIGGNTAVLEIETYDYTTGLWTVATGLLATARHHHTVTMMNDGRLLVAGGINIGAVTIDTVEIYNPWNDSIAAGPVMPAVRSDHAAVMMPEFGGSNGAVMISGGLDGAAVKTATCWYFDPTQFTWTAKTSMLYDRGYHTLTVRDDGWVVAFGTVEPEVWDPYREVWTQDGAILDGALVYAREKHASVLLQNGRVLATGGCANGNVNGLTSCLVYVSRFAQQAAGLNGEFTVTNVVDPTHFKVQTAQLYITYVTGLTEALVYSLTAAANPASPYVYDPDAGVAITGVETTVDDLLAAGQTYGSIDLADTTGFPDSAGFVVFAFGHSDAVVVPYLNCPSSTTLVLDRSFVFPVTVQAGSTVTLLTGRAAYVPASPQSLGGTYVTASPAGRVAASRLVDELTAVGINLDKEVLYPGGRGLGNEGAALSGTSKISDQVVVWGGDDLDDEIDYAREN